MAAPTENAENAKNAIVLAGVSKRFRRLAAGPTTLKSALLELFGRRRGGRRADEVASGTVSGTVSETEHWALRDIDVAVEAGTTLGVIGPNGSGKSTLLKLMAGIYRPTTGEIRVTGRMAALLELGAGFHPEFTGRENILINGLILGMTRREIAARMDAITAFAELGGFIDEPVRTYSSGMYMRLGFAVAVHCDPDVLLIDEVLAVGDAAFQAKCLAKLREFRTRGVTLVLVTHALEQVRDWCDRALLIRAGRVAAAGPPAAVIERYRTDEGQGRPGP